MKPNHVQSFTQSVSLVLIFLAFSSPLLWAGTADGRCEYQCAIDPGYLCCNQECQQRCMDAVRGDPDCSVCYDWVNCESYKETHKKFFGTECPASYTNADPNNVCGELQGGQDGCLDFSPSGEKLTQR